MLKIFLESGELGYLPVGHRSPAALGLLVKGRFSSSPEELLICFGLKPAYGQSCRLPKWQWGCHVGGMRGESPTGLASSLRLETPWDMVACQP